MDTRKLFRRKCINYHLKLLHQEIGEVFRDIVSLIRLSEGLISLSTWMESTGINYPLKTKIRHKTQNVNAKHLHFQCTVSGRSCGPSPYIFDICYRLWQKRA